MISTFSLLAQQGGGGIFGNPLIMIGLMLVMFYFVLIRPQKKQRKEQEARIAAAKKGDKVITIGGMHGIVHHVSKETITIKIAEGVFVPFNKIAIATVEKTGKAEKKADSAPSEEANEDKKV